MNMVLISSQVWSFSPPSEHALESRSETPLSLPEIKPEDDVPPEAIRAADDDTVMDDVHMND